MQKDSYTIRTMTRQEVNIAVDWAAEEGWNPGLHDADCFYAADPSGFLVGLLGDEPIATISAVKYGDSFGFIGFYIVKPEYRGQGYGIRIWNAGLALLGGRTIGLDGVVAQQDNYNRSGFTLAYSNVRYQGNCGGNYPADAGIVPLSTLAFDDVCAYDQAFFPDNRREFLRCWINQPQSTALGILRGNKLAGYGLMRICRTGFKVGPLFADGPECAEQLFAALKSHAPESASVFLDIPAVNAAAVDLVNRHNMTVSFETVRMYAGQCPDLPINQLFGVTTFELG
ncbi:MAG: GNAT family N-acetyltransferase [Methylobacter sp.]|uniref:GNAT family N-acetyltransferase n=1 Tax=Methylobacter sp. TaxID=2051955 RepID=UPI0025FBFA31|nr:GNAT family N-acetyltransferase [Methylobacter sp.]MCK9620277.1 GNAT family N-acetyltransferase [Methylobacter sp.]